MIFPTLNFLVFYLVVWPLSWAAVAARRHQLHKLIIIAASYVFYSSWNSKLALLLLFSVLLNWFAGKLIDLHRGTAISRLVCFGAVAINIAILGFFKYYNFFIDSLNELLHSIGAAREIPNLDIILPLGISFFTFQGISYVVDLHRRELDRARPLIDVMLFISFFAHLIAGPIVRAAQFLPQLEKPPTPNRVFVGLGVMLIGWGLFKKAVVANWIAVELVDKVFMAPSAFGGADLLFAVYGYAIQIYCDFSAYSDIAIGVAALLGYRFQRNFDQPYRAQSLQDFWRRWHITLSTWLRDYVYRPLGGNRHGHRRTYVNLLLTMLLGGLWHGASVKFVLWGALHGGGLAIERFVTDAMGGRRALSSAWARVLATVAVFHFVCFCWIFFRARDMAQAHELIAGLLDWSQPAQLLKPFIVVLVAIGMVIQFTPRDLIVRLDRIYQRIPVWGVGVLAGVVLLVVEVLGGDSTAPFIYFQF